MYSEFSLIVVFFSCDSYVTVDRSSSVFRVFLPPYRQFELKLCVVGNARLQGRRLCELEKIIKPWDTRPRAYCELILDIEFDFFQPSWYLYRFFVMDHWLFITRSQTYHIMLLVGWLELTDIQKLRVKTEKIWGIHSYVRHLSLSNNNDYDYKIKMISQN